jgi:hypothetical protein
MHVVTVIGKCSGAGMQGRLVEVGEYHCLASSEASGDGATHTADTNHDEHV